MAFTELENKIIQFGKENNKSRQEVEEAIQLSRAKTPAVIRKTAEETIVQPLLL